MRGDSVTDCIMRIQASSFQQPFADASGRKIAPNTGANATKFFALATKFLKLVANLATRISNHTLIPRDLTIVEDLLR